MTLNEIRDTVGEINKRNGFHTVPFNLGEKLMLVTSELSECVEADRKGNRPANPKAMLQRLDELNNSINSALIPPDSEERAALERMNFKKLFIDHVKDSVEAEIADAMIRLFDISYLLKIDLESIVGLTIHNNSLRGYLHGKKY